MTTAADFERAILAEPAADVPRLVYADWLDETGDPANAARAEYIRLQCEAARPSDLDHRRFVLEQRASLLFSDHWLDWWGPICVRVGLPEPSRVADPRQERAAGWPYSHARTYLGDCVSRCHARDLPWPARSLSMARFARGFVDVLDMTAEGDGDGGPSVADWLAAVPATGLVLATRAADDLAADDTPALRSVRKLAIDISEAHYAAGWLWSRHLTALEELELITEDGVTAFDLRSVARTPAAPRLRRLTLELSTLSAAAVLGEAASLVRLRDLTVSIDHDGTGRPFEPPDRGVQAKACLARLLAGPLSGRLERLSLFTYGDLPPSGFRDLARRPWPALRTLELLDPLLPDDVRAVAGDNFSHLQELFLVLEPGAADLCLKFLAQWPAVRRLTRLCFGGGTATADPERVVELAASLDLDVLQTFHLEPHADGALGPRLRAILGERLWMG